MNPRALAGATAVGLIPQLAMVIAGHFAPAVREQGFAVGGMAFSLLAGLIYARWVRAGWGETIVGGALAGGACAFLGIALSAVLKDVPASLLALGTGASIVTGALGGAVGRLVPRRKIRD